MLCVDYPACCLLSVVCYVVDLCCVRYRSRLMLRELRAAKCVHYKNQLTELGEEPAMVTVPMRSAEGYSKVRPNGWSTSQHILSGGDDNPPCSRGWPRCALDAPSCRRKSGGRSASSRSSSASSALTLSGWWTDATQRQEAKWRGIGDWDRRGGQPASGKDGAG